MEELRLEKIEGVVEEVVYHNTESGFTVIEVAVGEELVTVVGQTLNIAEGEEISASGVFAVHPSYGMQFKASIIERTLPSTASAILRYLSSGAVKGIGPALAKRIVARFGDQTLEIIEKEPQRLAEIKGISDARAADIAERFMQMFGVRVVMLFLSQQGIQPEAAIKIWKRWGQPAVELIRDNPYLLCCDEIGISFDAADEMAARFGLPTDDFRRISAGICHILRHNAHQGHVCLPEEKLRPMASEFLEIAIEKIDEAVEEMLESNTLARYEVSGRAYLYLAPLFCAESYVAGRTAMMLLIAPPYPPQPDEQEFEQLEQLLGITYAPLQREAIWQAVNNPVFILTGGPGTGKTTTMGGILKYLETKGLRVALAAPTGRAAKRMTEITGREAKTIHRLLEVDPTQQGLAFKRNERNPLAVDAVIVDEMSMVDILLMESLFRALRLGAKLILIGDSDQLPSVSAGNVLGDLIASERVPFVHLTQVFRQAQQSLIITGAHAIVHGSMPELGRKDGDCFFLPQSSQQAAQELVADLCARRLPKSYGFSPLRDIQVITPGKQGPLGTRELNRILQHRLNPPAPDKSQTESFGRILREGDKVMQIRNNYDILWTNDSGEEGQGIFNGDIGVIEMLDVASRTILIRFDDLVAQYSFEHLNQIEHAYAITVHKSQGSEFAAVIMPLMGTHSNLHYRNLLYTGFTRARKLLILAGSRDTVERMVANNRRTLRYTNLKTMLMESCDRQE